MHLLIHFLRFNSLKLFLPAVLGHGLQWELAALFAGYLSTPVRTLMPISSGHGVICVCDSVLVVQIIMVRCHSALSTSVSSGLYVVLFPHALQKRTSATSTII